MGEGALQSDEVVGAYRIRREVGRGAMGVVFEAAGPDGEAVALKVLAPPPFLTPEQRAPLEQRFLREARALSAVDHPNVVRVHAFGEDRGFSYLAMEFLDGENLRQLLARVGPLPPEQAVALVAQLCRALEAVHHAGIVHRDVKPENALVLRDGRLKLTDFGVVWVENEVTLTRTGGILGSPAYMSPEQVLGRPVDRRSDVFSASATLYQLLADRLPFTGASLLEMAHNVAYAEPAPLPPEVPRGLAGVVARGLHKSPAARFSSAAELGAALEASLRPPLRAARTLLAASPLPPALAADSVTATLASVPNADVPLTCARHVRQAAVGRCQACGRPMCRACARRTQPPYFCRVHAPPTLFGVPTVRLEVAVAMVAFLLLLLCLSPLGYAWLHRR